MSKAAPPLLGFNNNVRHRGRIFHIQTEDSGVKFPRIVTHLFADGGRIVKTTRTDYTEHVAKADMATVVRGMMKEQHKAMFAALRAGDMDELLEKACGPLEVAKSKPQEPASDPTATHDLDTARVVVAAGKAKSQPPPAPARAPEPVAASVQIVPPAPAADVAQALLDGPRSLRDGEGAASLRRPMSNPNLRRPTPSVAPPGAGGFDLDVASLDKNPPRNSVPASTRSSRKTNPPPRKSGPPSSRKTNPPPALQASPPSSRKTNPPPATRKSRPPIPVRPATSGAPAPIPAEVNPSSLGRPQTRLAAAPPGNARSIFGDGAISEQSLDEVILSYLAEDLEETK